jgi:DNA-directed RNA polymerase II subunit RPB2
MTINQLIECLFCKVAVQKGCAVDSTPFVNQGPKHKLLGGLLNEFDMHSSGNEILYNGMTGEQIESEIYMGPTYYTRLKHMTQDKINYRARGPRAALTRQTNHGRSKDGGLRIGDMERDSILSHGMSAFMYDSMMIRGDYYKMAICNHSGTIAIYNRSTQNFYSPVLDGPLQFEKTDVDTFVPNIITKYGKEFSIVEVPYCLKLLMHELTTMNVQMRLITADTIDSLTTAGKRSMGEFNTWAKKEPPLLLEKKNLETLLNQTLSDEEFKAIVDPTPEQMEELEEYEPIIDANVVPVNTKVVNTVPVNTKVVNTKVVNTKVIPITKNEMVPKETNSGNANTSENGSENTSENSNNASENSENTSENSNTSENTSENGSENGSENTSENATESTEAPVTIKKISFKK